MVRDDCNDLHHRARIERWLLISIFCLVAAVLVFFAAPVFYSRDHSRQRLHLFLVRLFVRQSVVTRRLGFQRASAVAIFNRRNPKRSLSAFLRRHDLVCDLDYIPGIPSPPVIFFISD